jgi:murein DD-endopeptidase MepM/ murein hydrolase activator NlpD
LPVEPLRITSKFGPRNTGIKGASKDHKGIDLGRDKSKAETNILSVAAGTVASNYWNKYRGWVVVIQHSGFRTLYQHLKAQSPLAVGTIVKSGTVLGVMGASSDKSVLKVSEHLHFELIVNGKNEDPEPYLKNIVKEDNEVVTKGKISIDGKIVELDRILKDGSNYVQLTDIAEALGCAVSYDSAKKIPVVKTK